MTGNTRVIRRLSARQEALARELAAGASGAEAARRAGYSPRRASQAAYEACVRNRDVRERIAELQAIAAAGILPTLEEHLAKLAELRDRAKNLGNFAAAVRAEELRGRVAGLYREPGEVKVDVAARVVTLPVEAQVEFCRMAVERMRELMAEAADLELEPRPPLLPPAKPNA